MSESQLLKILVVEDDSDYLFLLLRKLRAFFDVETVTTLKQAMVAFGSQTFGAVVMDLGLPDVLADDTVALMKKEYPNCAVVVLSGHEDPARIQKCILDSASSYLIKGRDDKVPEDLAAAINTAINSNAVCQKVEMAFRQLGSDI